MSAGQRRPFALVGIGLALLACPWAAQLGVYESWVVGELADGLVVLAWKLMFVLEFVLWVATGIAFAVSGLSRWVVVPVGIVVGGSRTVMLRVCEGRPGLTKLELSMGEQVQLFAVLSVATVVLLLACTFVRDRVARGKTEPAAPPS